MTSLDCPKGHGPMAQKTMKKEITFKGVDIVVPATIRQCPKCGLEAASPQAAGAVQFAIADAYRARQGLLTSQEMKALRKSNGLTQQKLADIMKIGIASIKRWETGTVQSASMDRALRMQLQHGIVADTCTGNRTISLSRIKRVAKAFEKLLQRRLLKAGDKFLFLAKYLWYADMIAYRQLGRSLTGASYAALPYGPQLNNYKDLIKQIKAADISDADPLSDEEHRIISRVAEKFPTDDDIYSAAHREKVWRDAETGALLPYSCANELREL